MAEWIVAGSALFTALLNGYLSIRHARYDNERFAAVDRKINGGPPQ